jgi:hypothetical protein
MAVLLPQAAMVVPGQPGTQPQEVAEAAAEGLQLLLLVKAETAA